MIRLAAIALGLCGLATPSVATEWVNCADPQGGASFDFLAGDIGVMSVAAITVTAGERVWASDPANGPGDPIVVGQAFETPDTIMIDAMDPAMAIKIAELRLFKAQEGDGIPAYGGTLRIGGVGAWVVSCSGP
jgi:hypothetical protein